MKFILKLNKKYHCLPTQIDYYPGLELLDEIRKELQVPNLNPLLISSTVDSQVADCCLQIALTEEEARLSGLFLDCANRTIDVPSNWQEAFYKLTKKVSLNDETGGIKSIELFYEVDREKFFQFWEDHGYFVDWIYDRESKKSVFVYPTIWAQEVEDE
jgi:hypothetical protein